VSQSVWDFFDHFCNLKELEQSDKKLVQKLREALESYADDFKELESYSERWDFLESLWEEISPSNEMLNTACFLDPSGRFNLFVFCEGDVLPRLDIDQIKAITEYISDSLDEVLGELGLYHSFFSGESEFSEVLEVSDEKDRFIALTRGLKLTASNENPDSGED